MYVQILCVLPLADLFLCSERVRGARGRSKRLVSVLGLAVSLYILHANVSFLDHFPIAIHLMAFLRC